MKYCHNCGSPSEAGAGFCTQCGTALKAPADLEGAGIAVSAEAVVAAEMDTAEPAGIVPHMAVAPAEIGAVESAETDVSAEPMGIVPAEAASITDVTALAVAAETPPVPPLEHPPGNKKTAKILKIAIPAVLVVALALVALFAFVLPRAQLNSIENAFENLLAETTLRIEATPITAVGQLLETFEDGTVSAGFEFNDSRLGFSTGGNITIASILDAREFALDFELLILGRPISAEVFINPERIAAGSATLGSDHYGFMLDTFRTDVRAFARLIRLNEQTVNDLADIVDFLKELLTPAPYPGDPAADEALLEHYLEIFGGIFQEFISLCTITTERTNFELGMKPDTESIRSTKVELTVPKEALVFLIESLYYLLENDEIIRNAIRSQLAFFDNAQLPSIFALNFDFSFNALLRQLRGLIDDFINKFEGELVLTGFIDRQDRLLHLDLLADITFDETRSGARASFDFGLSLYDRWILELTSFDDYDSSSVTVKWDFSDYNNIAENTLILETGNVDDMLTLSSHWSADTGAFLLAYNTYAAGRGELTGYFTTSDEGFALTFDSLLPEYSRFDLSVEIAGQQGADIPEIEFINIDRWGLSLMLNILRTFVF